MIFLEYALDVAAACRELGIKTVAVTAGYICPEPRVEFFRGMDAANVDLKAFTEDFYHRVCVSHLDAVLETLEYLKHDTDVWFELTTLLIPGLNDSDAEIDAMTTWVVEHLGPDVPMHFTAFHPDYKMRDRPPTPPRDAEPGKANRPRQRSAPRVHRQRARSGGGQHLLRQLRHACHRARLVSHRRVPARRDRPLRHLRDPAAGLVRRPRRPLGAGRQPVVFERIREGSRR